MKKITVLTIVFNIILMCSAAKAVTTNMEALAKTPYPHWHYFDPAMGNQIGRDPFFVSGTPSLSQDPAGPNRGNGSTARQFSFMDANNKLVVKYDMSSLGNSAYYLLQIANNYSLEFSSNGVDWVFISTNTAPYNNPAHQESAWQDKPLTNESPYNFDISSYLPADDFYVRIGDASTGNGWGGMAFNALISKYGYPYFFAGGSEPDVNTMNGDQQWLYQKTECPDIVGGRYADLKNYFVYKFDLPDGDDTCWIHCRIRGQFIFEIARDSVFSTVDLVISNNPGDTTERTLNIPLKDILNLTSDNLIYVRVRNSAPAGGNGGQLYNFWISPQPTINSTTTFLPISEEEIQILWENHAYNTTAHQRFADGTAHFTYRLDFGDISRLSMNIAGEYLIDVSTNNIDWVNIFNAGAGARDVQNISYNPFTGETLGIGATGNPALCSVSDDGMTNILYVRISDADTSSGWGGNLQNLTVTVLEPSKRTSAKPFALNDHIISTSFFHWYTPTSGQSSGPWRPRDGRDSWTGESEWWKTQIKQVMLAGIDIMYVHLIPAFEQQRINLFRALSEMRYDGYNVPKIVPFLDPVITWDGQPTYSLADAANRQKIVDQYIRFYHQYYSVNTDEFADDYIGIIDNRVALDTWHLWHDFTDISSFHRNHLETPLAAEFGAAHPIFNNGIYMITSESGNTFSFADEQVRQFQSQEYSHITDYNGIKSDQLKAGYWDQNIRDPGTCLKRDGGVNYSHSWATYPDPLTVKRVYIESWNEFDEGSGIFAANPTQVYKTAVNTSNDDWSDSNDPLEYIKTTLNGAKNFRQSEINNKGSKILWNNIPTNMFAGETNHCTVYVRNTGFDIWTSTNVITQPNFYYFGQLDTDSQGFGLRRYPFDNLQNEADLYLGIFKGRPVKFDMEIIAPEISGRYETHWKMLQENVAWFGEEITNTIYIFPIPEPVSIFCLLFIIYYLRNKN